MMLYWNEYIPPLPQLVGKKVKYDNNIYSFDIETTSYFILDGKIHSAIDYKDLSKKEQQNCEFRCNMYIWMFGVNDRVYYGRTWDELKKFIKIINDSNEGRKIIFVHNLAFEFQFLKSIFDFTDVTARISHKVMKCAMQDYNIEFRCSLMMSNCALKYLPKLFGLPVEKKVGDLDYSLIRHSKTELTTEELGYCENDCLVVYYYIKKELEDYQRINKIPLTSTGHVRRELQELTRTNWKYRKKVYKAINTDAHVYNMLLDAFQGGYTHGNWLFTDEIVHDVDSYDFTSSYPYVLVTHRYPSTEFKKCNIQNREQMDTNFAYLLKVRFYNIECKYYNTFISQSKCSYVDNSVVDNGRIVKADCIEITLTDIDFYFYLDSYNIERYEILESYNSVYDYLPKLFIEFVLEKYVNKTKFKNVVGKEIEYQKEKNKFNSLYGMSVTNMIRDDVIYDNITGWNEKELTNDDMISKLNQEKKKCFLSFAYGVWCTAYARNNLLRNVIKLDDYAVYMDTDSIKLRKGYDKKVIDDYNNFVRKKIQYVSNKLKIPIEKFAPEDSKGVTRMLGLFDDDGHYDKFINQGAKKYAVEVDGKIKITVAGVPKEGAKELKRIEDFRDDLVFHFENTNKQLLFYIEDQKAIKMVDYQGNELIVTDISGCGLFPCTYVLGKALEYSDLLTDNSSKRARYKEVI